MVIIIYSHATLNISNADILNIPYLMIECRLDFFFSYSVLGLLGLANAFLATLGPGNRGAGTLSFFSAELW